MADEHLNTPEVWKAIPDFPGYEVSDHGRVRSYWKLIGTGHARGNQNVLQKTPQRILKQCINKTGYYYVGLFKDKQQSYNLIHRLVLETFVGPCPKDFIGCHNDGDKTNNHVTNLRWDTIQSNHEDMRLHGTILNGIKNHNAKITDGDACMIRLLHSYGVPMRTLSDKFNLAFSTISKIIKRQAWTHC